jgi:5-formyltetrahydrofolate cyclo-ligase
VGQASQYEDVDSLYWHVVEAEALNLQPNAWGIEEPLPTAPQLNTPPAVVLLPCLTMDKYGSRVGYGKGFYDRALKRWQTLADQAKLPPPLTVAVCWQACVVQEQRIQSDAWDVSVAYVLTEAGLVKTTPYY